MHAELIAKEISNSLGLLTDTDFEWFSAMLVKADIRSDNDGKIIEHTYPKGRDGGVDWFLSLPNKSYIIQAVNYKGETSVKRKAMGEVERISKLPPETRGPKWSYYFCVSCPIKPSLRVELVDIFKKLDLLPGYSGDPVIILDANNFAMLLAESESLIEIWGRLSSTYIQEKSNLHGISAQKK